MEDETYVMNVDWIQPVGRPDLIDDVADQFERPALESAALFGQTYERALEHSVR